MMFCRSDIFDVLKLTPPKTWDELVIKTLPALERDNMEIGIGNISNMSNISSANIFTTILYQRGGSLYSKDLMTSSLDSQTAYDAFDFTIKLYRDYQLPQADDPMNRFRTGEMPLVIEPYTMYNNLALGAPELTGLWQMYPIPGTVKSDNSVDISQVFSGTSSIMFQKTKDKASAWAFMKWWASPDTQTNFGLEQEAVLGPAGRYDPANIVALQNLPWDSEQLQLLENQMKSCITVPQLPGSYFTSRAINSAFVSSVIDYKIPREELLYWNDQINIELARKRTEFNFHTVAGGTS